MPQCPIHLLLLIIVFFIPSSLATFSICYHALKREEFSLASMRCRLHITSPQTDSICQLFVCYIPCAIYRLNLQLLDFNGHQASNMPWAYAINAITVGHNVKMLYMMYSVINVIEIPSGYPVVSPQRALCCLIIMSCHFGINKLKLAIMTLIAQCLNDLMRQWRTKNHRERVVYLSLGHKVEVFITRKGFRFYASLPKWVWL